MTIPLQTLSGTQFSSVPVAVTTPPAGLVQAEAPPSAPLDQVQIGGPRGRLEGEPTVMDRVLDSNTITALVGAGLKSGETVTISSNGEALLQIHKESVSTFDKIKVFASDAFHVTAAEVSNIVAQDPAFAFKESALAVKDQVFRGVPTELSGVAEQAFLPMIRVVAIALDTKKAFTTWKNQASTRIDKFVDSAHLVTDVAGLGGAVGRAIPGVGAAVATGLTVAGLVGDIAAYGYHVMKYFMDRGMPTPEPTPPVQVASHPAKP